MKHYNNCLLGMGETRWLQTGHMRLITGETLLYSGHSAEGVRHTEGVDLMQRLEGRTRPYWIRTYQTPDNKKSKIKLNIIQCNAPYIDVDDEKKDGFYQQLPTVLDKAGKNDMTILMGDFNAKMGWS